MKVIWTIIGVFVLIIVGLIAARLFRSDLNYRAQAAIQITASRDDVYRQLAVLENWTRWSPFVPDHAPEVVLDDNPAGPSLSWKDPRGGTAVLKLLSTDSVAGTVRHELNSPIFPPMQGTIQVESIDEDHCQVKWSVQGALPNSIFYRLMSENYGESLAGQLNQSLHRLKSQLESPPPSPE